MFIILTNVTYFHCILFTLVDIFTVQRIFDTTYCMRGRTLHDCQICCNSQLCVLMFVSVQVQQVGPRIFRAWKSTVCSNGSQTYINRILCLAT